MLMSRMLTSGFNCLAFSTASFPLVASADNLPTRLLFEKVAEAPPYDVMIVGDQQVELSHFASRRFRLAQY